MYCITIITDVLALAAALGQLMTCTAAARTAFWCALQMSIIDLPASCLHAAVQCAKRGTYEKGPRVLKECEEADTYCLSDEEQDDERPALMTLNPLDN